MTHPAPTACDCLNHCGDDPWLSDGRASYCQHYLDARQREADARELACLERRIAYSAARADIECNELFAALEPTATGGYVVWFVSSTLAAAMPAGHVQSPDDHDYLDDATRYLRLRGLIEDHPTQPGWIRVLDLP